MRTIIVLLILAPIGLGQDGASPRPTLSDPQVQSFLTKHCQECHGGEKPKGNFRLDQITSAKADDAWRLILEQVQSGDMPPKKKPRPPEGEVKAVLQILRKHVTAADSTRRATEGRVRLRRLNRVEYENTLRDLLSVDVDVQDLLPADASAHGFDNVGEALHASSFLMERYLESADRALDAAIANGPRPWIFKNRIDLRKEHPSGDVYRKLDDGSLAIFSSWISANICVPIWQFTAKFPGKYHVRMSAYGMQNPGKPATFFVEAGTMQGVTSQHLVGYFEVPNDKPTVIEFTDFLQPRETFRIIAEGLGVTPPTVQKVGAQNYKGPGLAVQWVEIEGPLMDAWPPASHRKLFGDLALAPDPEEKNRFQVTSKNPAGDADRILRDFTRRAFRRTVTDEDIRPFLARFKAKMGQGYTFEDALRVALKAVMVAPDFLFLREGGGKLGDFALASRLSYFLWSSMPDEELLSLAAQQKLGQSETLRAQVERLLKDPKAAAFTKNFVGQWLSLRNIDATTPDYSLYPEFSDGLKEAMIQEPYAFFDEVLKNDLSLANFVASDFSMLNAPLGALYGIPGLEGRELRKTTLPPNSHRGGVLTMAAILKVTANGTATSPIIRGAWVLDRILGTPPAPPPGDVEAVAPDIRGATTIREQLSKHRQLPECRHCHAQIDPPGFALESFDVMGGWRENYRSLGKGETISGKHYKKGPAVDAADVLPDGRKFQNIDEFKQLLLKDKDQLARALTYKLVTYGTGGAPGAFDKPVIDAIVDAVRSKDYGLRTLVHEIVQSKLFRTK